MEIANNTFPSRRYAENLASFSKFGFGLLIVAVVNYLVRWAGKIANGNGIENGAAVADYLWSAVYNNSSEIGVNVIEYFAPLGLGEPSIFILILCTLLTLFVLSLLYKYKKYFKIQEPAVTAVPAAAAAQPELPGSVILNTPEAEIESHLNIAQRLQQLEDDFVRFAMERVRAREREGVGLGNRNVRLRGRRFIHLQRSGVGAAMLQAFLQQVAGSLEGLNIGTPGFQFPPRGRPQPQLINKLNNLLSNRMLLTLEHVTNCENCAICTDDFEVGDFVPDITHSCLQRHYIHGGCLENWMTQTMKSFGELRCPICRANV